MVAWGEYKKMKDHDTSARQLMGDSFKKKIKENLHFIKLLGQVVLVTCTQKLAQRGHREGEETDNPGNVRKILKNEIICILAVMIKTEIVNEAKEAKFFSIIVDETKDVSKTEQLSLIIRYCYKENLYESFLDFKAAFQLDANALTHEILNVLKRHEIYFKANLVGQGFDGVSVMSGRHKGVAARIKQEAPFAFYVHCHAHRLNLVLVDVIKSLPDASQFFSLLEKLYVFISGSYAHAKWIDVQKELYPNEQTRQLKRLSDTRWACRYDACKVIRDRLSAVLANLDLVKAVELIETVTVQLEEMRSDPSSFDPL
ncbi:zinc finger MYM-type protein 1-like [Macrobrachium rosenbergii]|uniref:zinc finger MYM-type protein 1-like n=1 Tax=Macrobrachium rosenbergii TaxID=79674 RepID=UPI0034D65AC9